jgi:bacterioferritin-associated ferredoxin
MKSVKVEAVWPGREELRLDLGLNENNEITHAKLTGIGGPDFLSLLTSYRPQLKGGVKSLPLPAGVSAGELCLREVILKARGEWNYPYKEVELCHCRGVDTEVVDQAICNGAHTPRKVSELTSASTACGTCRPDVEAILKFRLGK